MPDGFPSQVLVTGGAGFIGRRVVGDLCDPATIGHAPREGTDVADAARAVTGAEIPVEYVPAKPGEMSAVIIDSSAARTLGYQPTMDLKAGIATVWPESAETVK